MDNVGHQVESFSTHSKYHTDPNFMVIACSDSRLVTQRIHNIAVPKSNLNFHSVAPETVFSALPGTVFSERVVANQFDPEDLPE